MKNWLTKSQELSQIDGGKGRYGRNNELIEVAEGADSNPIGMATITVVGKNPGPKVWIQAQTHGDEPNSTAAILDMMKKVDPDTLSGVIVAAPAMHTAAVRHFLRESPLDGKNGNRIWGIDWTKLGHTKVFSYVWMQRVGEIISNYRPDLVIDMHDGGTALKIISHVLYDINNTARTIDMKKLAVDSGMHVIWAYKGGRFGGSVGDFTASIGIPCLMLESGGTGHLCFEDIEEMSTGLLNTLKALNMLPGKLERKERKQLTMTNGNWVRSMRAGLFYPAVIIGQLINKNDVIGHVVNLFGEATEEILSPVEGMVFGLRHSAVTDVGSYVANIGELGR